MRDLEIISKELRLKDVAAVEKIIDPLAKEVKPTPTPTPTPNPNPSPSPSPNPDQVGRLLLLSAFNLFICQQYIRPLLLNSVSALDAVDLPRLGERLLKLALPCT